MTRTKFRRTANWFRNTRVGGAGSASFSARPTGCCPTPRACPLSRSWAACLFGYFQYLNAYQDKVTAQAKEDMTAATNTFMEIANAFSEAQTLQQILFFDFSGALDGNTEASEQALTTKDARGIFPGYEHARKTLRQNSCLLARKAEIYIDWASDFGRDAALARTPTTDPLTQPLLGAYNFDCDDAANFPQFETASSESGKGASAKPVSGNPNEDPCQVDKDQGNYDPPKSYVNLCARQNGAIVPSKPAIP